MDKRGENVVKLVELSEELANDALEGKTVAAVLITFGPEGIRLAAPCSDTFGTMGLVQAAQLLMANKLVSG